MLLDNYILLPFSFDTTLKELAHLLQTEKNVFCLDIFSKYLFMLETRLSWLYRKNDTVVRTSVKR